jgi:hypothetical protein
MELPLRMRQVRRAAPLIRLDAHGDIDPTRSEERVVKIAALKGKGDSEGEIDQTACRGYNFHKYKGP